MLWTQQSNQNMHFFLHNQMRDETKGRIGDLTCQLSQREAESRVHKQSWEVMNIHRASTLSLVYRDYLQQSMYSQQQHTLAISFVL